MAARKSKEAELDAEMDVFVATYREAVGHLATIAESIADEPDAEKRKAAAVRARKWFQCLK
jgi:hypothetical protein